MKWPLNKEELVCNRHCESKVEGKNEELILFIPARFEPARERGL